MKTIGELAKERKVSLYTVLVQEKLLGKSYKEAYKILKSRYKNEK